MSLHIFKSILQTFTSSMNYAWQYYQTPKSAITSEQFYLLNLLLQFHLQNNLSTSKSKMAFSCCNSSTSTLVPLLGTPFNTISYFSDHLAYLPNALWWSRQIYQKDCSSLMSLSSTIYSGWTVLPVPGPSIITVDNDFNWEDAPTNSTTNTIIANRPTSSTHS